MTTIRIRRALLGMGVATAIMALAASASFAAAPAGPPGCGPAMVAMMNYPITTTPPSPPGTTTGRNFVSFPRVGPVNGAPTNLAANGFIKICQGLDRPGGLAFDVNGDSITDTGLIFQYEPVSGSVNTHNCANALAGAAWDTGQGAEIRVLLGGGLGSIDVPLMIKGVAGCAQEMAVYKNPTATSSKGKFFVPYIQDGICKQRDCLCDQLNLPDNSVVQTILTSAPSTGNVETYICHTPRDLDGNPPLRAFESVLTLGSNAPGGGVTTDGLPVNCLAPGGNPVPCPATPAAKGTYPTPAIF